ncbi:Cupin domain protein [bacterium A37T11]|nr:Cupin domain protein [bacterium A37T11]
MKQNISIKEGTAGEYLSVAGGNYRIIISGQETDGNYTVIEMNVPPGGGPAPHSHPAMEETFYLLEGQLEFKTEEVRQVVGEGGFVKIPKGGAIHCFKNTSSKIVRMICTVMPAGLDNYFREIGIPAEAGEVIPMPILTQEAKNRIQQLNEKYGTQTYPMDYLDSK